MNLGFAKVKFPHRISYKIIDMKSNEILFSSNVSIRSMPREFRYRKVQYIMYDDEVFSFYINDETEPNEYPQKDDFCALFRNYTINLDIYPEVDNPQRVVGLYIEGGKLWASIRPSYWT